MQRWIVIGIIVLTFLAGCNPQVSPAPPPTSTSTPPGLSQQLNILATQTQLAALTATADAQQTQHEGQPFLYPTQSPSTPLALPLETAGPFHQISRQEVLIAGNVLDLQVRRGDVVVLLSENGISGLSDGEWLGFFTGEIGYPVGMDVTRRTWIAAHDGAVIYRAEPDIWYTWNENDNLIMPFAFDQEAGWAPAGSEYGRPVEYGLLTDSRGDLWLATSKDVRYFNGTWNLHDSQTMGMPGSLEGTREEFTILPLLSTGEVLVGRCDWGSTGPQGGGGVRAFDGQAWREVSAELNSGCVTAIAESQTGDIWLALDNNLYHHDQTNEIWEQITLPEAPQGEQFGYFTALTADPAQGVWAQLALCNPEGCFGGEMLYQLNNGVWIPIGEPSPTSGRRMLFNSSGAPWLLAAGNISQISGTTLQPIPGLLVLAATNDEAGNLWLIAQSSGAPTLWTDR